MLPLPSVPTSAGQKGSKSCPASCSLREWKRQSLSTLLAKGAGICHKTFCPEGTADFCKKMGFGELPAKHWHVSGEITVLWWTPQGSTTRGMEILSKAHQSQDLPKSSKPRGLVSSLNLVGPVSSRCSRESQEPHATVSSPAPHWKFAWFPPAFAPVLC